MIMINKTIKTYIMKKLIFLFTIMPGAIALRAIFNNNRALSSSLINYI